MNDFNNKKEVLNELIRKTESDYYKTYLTRILYDLEHYDRITKTKNYFYLNESQAEKVDEFRKEYLEGKNFGAIGGGLYFTFMPTGLGDVVSVWCKDDNGKRIEEDLTESEHW